MSRNLKALLQQKADENTQRHHDAQYTDDFDVGRQHKMLPMDKIDRNPHQPRIRFDEEKIKKLAMSISSAGGLIEPIVVRAMGDRYELIAGERRWLAHKELGKPTIEGLVISADDAQSAMLALAENIEREDLTDFEIAMWIKKVSEQFPQRSKLAESIGIARSDLYRFLAFQSLPEEVLARLQRNPDLIARTAASDIAKVLKDAPDDDALRERLLGALTLVEQQQLDQTKVAAFIVKAPQSQIVRSKPTHIMRGGRKVGTFVNDGSKIVLKIAVEALTDEQTEKLQRFVVEMFE
ncbi:ParB/RepB/Spo0J family partition protein [Paraburkholderia sediminicola]|uniref:ParB/RepB/Spo0J family partition protein n=1 Tax=Paraburkholderia sediminicola TaxID=458836 RepID=UPI0038BA7E74